MNAPIHIGLVGFGKIARDEHVPAIARTDGVELVAVASRNATAEGVANYPDLDSMLAGQPDLDAIVLCQPPKARFAAARTALLAGKHVFLEKPPGATLSEVDLLSAIARDQGVTLYASWHSRYSAPVAELKHWCATHKLRRIRIDWKEDVRLWHPGQDWIWEAGGFGVFDPGINALSILTEAVPEAMRLIDAKLEFPSNRQAPIAAVLDLETTSGVPVHVEFDWRQTGAQTWQIVVESDDDTYVFAQGGEDAVHTDTESTLAPEYRAMHQRFSALIEAGESEVDLAPLQLVADAFLRGQHCVISSFDD